MCNSILYAMKDQKSFEVFVQGTAGERREVVDKLFQRSELRLAEIERKKSGKDEKNSVYERTDYFDIEFSTQKKRIEDMLSEAWSMDKAELVSHFDEIVHSFQASQKFLSDSILFLPTYDIKKNQELLKALQDEIQSAQDILLPKKKFTFKNKKKQLQNGSPKTIDLSGGIRSIKTQIQLDKTDSMPRADMNHCGFRNLSNQILIKKRDETHKEDLGLYNLTNCTVYLYGAPSTVIMSGLKNCKVFSGPVSTSVFVENCIQCSFSFACQQLRVHTTEKCCFYLHVVSRSIIEDSKELHFGVYDWSYEGQDLDFDDSGLDRRVNNWQCVDDFNWLVIDAASPNWSLIHKDKNGF